MFPLNDLLGSAVWVMVLVRLAALTPQKDSLLLKETTDPEVRSLTALRAALYIYGRLEDPQNNSVSSW